jgi:metal-dependent amidase/aminoacylase/carboxypeptidase family protein
VDIFLVVNFARLPDTPPPLRRGEDFSYFLAEKPGCMIFVGSRNPGGELLPHHHPSFDIDERALLVGPSFFVALVERILCQRSDDKDDPGAAALQSASL